MNKILIVEDDEGIRTTLKEILTEREFLVETAEDGIAALNNIKKSPPDLLLLDLGLPKVSGESICKEVHKMYPALPIIIVTAKNNSQDVVNGLTIGAIDYIRKPFDIDELIARIKVRLKVVETDTLQANDLQMNTKNMEVTRGGKVISLTPHEFKLLQYLLMNKGQVLTREMILNRVWQYTYDVDSRVVDVYIGYLRKKLEDDPKKPLITGLRGFGYSIKD
jgi:DNA-binding response OmpR family regulator